MEYQVVVRSDLAALELFVNILIGLGWEPQGGITFVKQKLFEKPSVAQAMIRKEQK